MLIFKARIQNIDYPKVFSEEEYFDSFAKAEQFIVNHCNKIGIVNPPWEMSGRGFWDCKDGAIRSCMMNVKFKIETEKKLIEE